MPCERIYQLTLRAGEINPFGMEIEAVNPLLLPAGFKWLQSKISLDFFVDQPEIENGVGFVIDGEDKKAVIAYEFDLEAEADMIWIGGITPKRGLLTQTQLLMIKRKEGIRFWETHLRLKEMKGIQDIPKGRRNFDTFDLVEEIESFLDGVAFEEFLLEEFHCRGSQVISPRRADQWLKKFGLGLGADWSFSGHWTFREFAEIDSTKGFSYTNIE